MCKSFVQGYALLCVGFPTSDVEVETQDEDEVMRKTTITACCMLEFRFGSFLIDFGGPKLILKDFVCFSRL